MRIEHVHICGFRCFDATGQSIALAPMTCLVGPNASGKTATMVALARMFSGNQSERAVQGSDFHIPAGQKLASTPERSLSVEVKLVFSELEGDDPNGAAVPESFNQMVVDEPGGTPYCRIALEATWVDDGTPAGDIQQRLWWVLTPSRDPAVAAENRRPVNAGERARIRVVYVPAARDPSAQIRATSTTVFGKLLGALDWAEKDDSLRARLQELNVELGQLPGVGTMNQQVQAAWSSLYDGAIAANVTLESIEADPSALLKLLAPIFVPDELGQELSSDELSDGLRSLFALSLQFGLFRVEERLKMDAQGAGFRGSAADGLPVLTLFAVEEPENHLSPHYVGKVISQLYEIASTDCAQVVMSSHSPSVMRRIEPDHVRYLLGGENRRATSVRSLDLPRDRSDEAFKYVREAVRGYPELYFSRLVVLGEGPSEEIVLRALFEANGAPLDSCFISVVPLGGRHVNHFWRLLNGLGIPYVTLLDLDREKGGAGWRRLKYVRDQLVDLHAPTPEKIAFTYDGGNAGSLTDPCFDDWATEDDRTSTQDMHGWMKFLREQFGVFFSAPLDLDFSLLQSFPDAYKSQAPPSGGPRLPSEPADRSEEARRRMRHVLTTDWATAPDDLGASYEPEQVDLFPWYKYLFVDGSKPVAHMRAVHALRTTDWATSAPEELKALLQRSLKLVAPTGL